MTTTTTIYPDGDTYLNEGQSTTNYSSSGLVDAGLSGSNKKHMLFKFDVSGYTPTDISAANFMLKLFRETGSITHTMTVARIAHDFVVAECTWDIASDATSGFDWDGAAQFALTDEQTYTIEVGDVGTDQIVDIKELVIDAINRRSGILNLIVCFLTTDTPSGTGNSSFYSVNYTVEADRAKINVVVADRRVWVGTADGDVSNNLNWLGGVTPEKGDYALFANTTKEVTSGSLDCERIYIGKNYKGKIGTAASPIALDCVEFHTSCPYADVHVDLNASASSNTNARVNDTKPTSDSSSIDGKYDATLNRTRSDLSLKTSDVTLINALSNSVTFTADDDVTTVRLAGANATLEDGGGTITLTNGANVLLKRVDEDDTNLVVSNSLLRNQASDFDQITLYSGTVTLRGNTGSPIQAGGLDIYDGIFDARTLSATFTMGSAVRIYGGRLLLDAGQTASIA